MGCCLNDKMCIINWYFVIYYFYFIESWLILLELEFFVVVILIIDVLDVELINYIIYLKLKLFWVGCINSKKENIIN